MYVAGKAWVPRLGFGHTRVTKDFLLQSSRAEVVHRDADSRRRKCDAVELGKLDAGTVIHLKAGSSLEYIKYMTVLSSYNGSTSEAREHPEDCVGNEVLVRCLCLFPAL